MGESLICKRESENPNDPYTVAIRKGSEVVGHVPKEIICSLFDISADWRTVCCEITDNQRYYYSGLSQGGLEIPCKFVFQGDTKQHTYTELILIYIYYMVNPIPETHT